MLFFFGFNSFGGWVGFGFCGLILSFAALRECSSFCLFLNNKFQELFYNYYYSRPHLLAQKRAILANFWCFWRMTFREIEQFVLDGRLVLFVVDNFRLHRFLHKKTPRKSWFFCVSLSPIWIPLKRQSIFKFFWIPGSLLRPPDVRIWNETTLKSACFWNAQKLLKKSWFYRVLKILLNTPHLGWCWAQHSHKTP